MCGIAGYCGPSNDFDDAALGRMLQAIEHRGPDDCGVFSAPLRQASGHAIWMGSRRLAIQDLSPAGHQPMADEATGHVIAFNGEIYNFLDLRSELEHQGVRFQSRCDTEVALRAWCLRGLVAVNDWRGMFGAALWDPTREELWLVRDPWGIKPLYYCRSGDGLGFCSEIRGLLAGGLASRRLSRRGVEDYLRFGVPQDPVTIIDGVYALMPGHALRWSRGQIEIRRYVQPRHEAQIDAASIEPMLRQIVRQQLISDRPVVVFLSGGVDSSIIALLARREAGPGTHTISVIFDEDRYSERHYARRVAEHLGTKHHEVRLRGIDAQAKALEAISRMDQPSIDAVNTYVVSGAAHRAGFTVALSGLGGDEFFGGYPSFRRMARLLKLQQAARAAPSLAAAAGRVLATVPSEQAGKLSHYLRDGDFWEHPYFFQRTLFFPQQIEALCPEGDRSSEADRLAEASRQTLLEEAQDLDALNQVSLLEARTYMANMLLRDSDQMSMAHSLELRVPFVDHRLAAALLAVPGERKGFGRTSKLWLCEAFSRYLPPEVFARKKMGFTLPFAVWLKGPLRAEVERTLSRDEAGLWRPQASSEVWQSFLQGRIGWSRPWALYVLSRWAAA